MFNPPSKIQGGLRPPPTPPPPVWRPWPNPSSKAYGFSMRSMSLCDIQMSLSENVILASCQILATPLMQVHWLSDIYYHLPPPGERSDKVQCACVLSLVRYFCLEINFFFTTLQFHIVFTI